MPTGFENKVVVVTGGARGIGRTVAQTYAEQGAHVVVVDKDEDELRLTASRIQEVRSAAGQGGGECDWHVANLADANAIPPLFSAIAAKRGKVDVLINNAGIGIWKSPLELDVDEWDRVLNGNLRGTFLSSREAARLMTASGGAIVNMASTRALMSEANSEAYAASKGGILALTHALAVSFGPSRIRVNAISPGWIETGDYEQLRPVDHTQHPSQRVGTPSDIARACLFLTHPDNDFITGENLVIDGGMTRKMIYVE